MILKYTVFYRYTISILSPILCSSCQQGLSVAVYMSPNIINRSWPNFHRKANHYFQKNVWQFTNRKEYISIQENKKESSFWVSVRKESINAIWTCHSILAKFFKITRQNHKPYYIEEAINH